MRKLLSILLLLSVLAPNLSKIWIVVDFQINQDFIAEVLCINKEKPITSCGGKCFLNKRISQTENTADKDAPSKLDEKIEIITLFKQKADDFQIPELTSSLVSIIFTEGPDLLSSSITDDIFRPPIASNTI